MQPQQPCYRKTSKGKKSVIEFDQIVITGQSLLQESNRTENANKKTEKTALTKCFMFTLVKWLFYIKAVTLSDKPRDNYHLCCSPHVYISFKRLSAHCFGFTAQNFIAFVHSHCSHQSPASAGRKLYAAQRKRPYAYLPCRKWHTKVAASSSHLTRPLQHWRKFWLHQFSFRHNGRKKTVWLVCISACGNSVRELVLLVVSFYS